MSGREAPQEIRRQYPLLLAGPSAAAIKRSAPAEWAGAIGGLRRTWSMGSAPRSFNDVGRLSPAERSRRALQQARANEADLHAILTEAQQARLRQIGVQSEGPGAFRETEVVSALKLSADQRERIRAIEAELSLDRREGPPRGPEFGSRREARLGQSPAAQLTRIEREGAGSLLERDRRGLLPGENALRQLPHPRSHQLE